jgi:hypothetical protein
MENENDDLIVPSNFGNYSQSSDDIQINQGDIFNYRGYFVDKNQHGDNDDDDTQKFYEFGAHFPYYFLVQKLEILKMENDKQNKKEQIHHNHTPNTIHNKCENELEGLINIPIKHNARSRNRNCNFGIQSDNPHIIDKFSAIPHDKINNDEKTKQPNHNAISMILKDSTSNAVNNKENNINDINIHNLNNKTEISNTHKNNNNKSVKAYTSFANKLKEAKRINGRNHNNITNLPHSKNRTQITNNNANNNNKNKTLHITNDKTRNINNQNNAISQSTTTSKQKNKLEKKIKQSTKHHPDLSTLKYNSNNNNNHTNKKSRSKSKELSASSHNNQPSSKIAASINNLLTSYKYKRNIHFSPGLHPQPTKITQKRNNLSNNNNNNININQVKILTKNKINDFISSLSKSSYHKSRNIHTHNAAISSCAQNYNKVNLTNNTKSNAQTDRENNNKQQHVIVHKEKSRSESSKIRGVRNMKVNTNHTKDKMIKQDSTKKFKTYLDMRYSVFNKTNQQIINEIKKKIANTKHTGHQHSNSKSNNMNTIKTKSKSRSKSKSQSKTTKSYKTLKHSTINANNININININNNNKYVYNKIISINPTTKYKGKIIFSDGCNLNNKSIQKKKERLSTSKKNNIKTTTTITK